MRGRIAGSGSQKPRNGASLNSVQHGAAPKAWITRRFHRNLRDFCSFQAACLILISNGLVILLDLGGTEVDQLLWEMGGWPLPSEQQAYVAGVHSRSPWLMGNNEKPRRCTWGHIDLPRLLTFCASLLPSHLGTSPESVLHQLVTVMQRRDHVTAHSVRGPRRLGQHGLSFPKVLCWCKRTSGC